MSSVDIVAPSQEQYVWKLTPLFWGALLVCSVLLVFIFYDGLELMVSWWMTREEYGHGVMIPAIVGFLIWQKSDQLESIDFIGSWYGVVLVIFGVSLYFLGEISSIYILIQYAFLITVYGVILSLTGNKAFRVILIPLLILFFMMPLPNFIFNDLSSQLQLISSKLGVAVIRLFDISVYLEGNIIDLGTFKLQVVEACSGLNYLFPLMTLGFIAAYFFTGSFWKKSIIFLSTIPITILMNSFRIGVIGVTVEYWGQDMAEGFLHDFQGWAVFMSCTSILVLEMWLLSKIGKNQLPLREAFGIDFPESNPSGLNVVDRNISKMFVISIVILGLSIPLSQIIDERQEVIPERSLFSDFPLHLNNWNGQHQILEQIYVDALKLTDYALINYKDDIGKEVNFYSAYYESQRKDSTTHSPRACIPGGGWEIEDTKTISLDGVSVSSVPLTVNRLVIEKEEVRQLVYYWFKQRDRIVTNEQMIKFYFFIDSIKHQRTDGALIRLTTMVPEGESLADADERLLEFSRELAPHLTKYIPGR